MDYEKTYCNMSIFLAHNLDTDMKNLLLGMRFIHIRITKRDTTMKFNLKEKLQQAKDAGTAALTISIIAVDGAADRALERLGDLQDAAGRKTGEIRMAVSEKVGQTKDALKTRTDAVREKTVTNLGKLGDAIEEKATKVGSVAAEFGKSARKRLNLRQPEPAVEAAAAAVEAVKPAKKAKKRPVKKAQNKPHRRA
jgi:hypothetical protein